jgi:hypothetical protein
MRKAAYRHLVQIKVFFQTEQKINMRKFADKKHQTSDGNIN